MARELVVKIVGDASSLEHAFKKSSGAADNYNSRLNKVGRAAGVAGLAIGGALVVGLTKATQGAIEDERAQARLAQAFKQSHDPIDRYAGAIDKAQDAAVKFGFEDEQAVEALGSLEIATHDGRKAIDLLGTAMDVARFKHIDLQTASKTLTGAMAGNQRAIKQLGITIQPTTAHMDALKAQYKKLGKEIPPAAKEQAKFLDKQQTTKNVIDLVSNKLRGQADAYSKTAAGGVDRMNASLDQLSDNIGKGLLPALESVTGVLAKFFGFLADHQTTAKVLVASVGALAGVLLAVSAATKVYAAGATIVAAATKAWAVVQFVLNAALTANPIGIIVVGLVALGAALVIAWKKSETFRDIVLGTLNAVKNIGQAIADFFTKKVGPAFVSAFRAASDALETAWNVIQPILKIFKDYAEGIIQVFEGLVNFFTGVFTGDWNRAWEGVKQIVGGAFQAIKALILGAPALLLAAVVALGRAIIAGIKSGIDAAWPLVKEFFTSLPERIQNLIQGAAQWLFEKGRAVMAGLLQGMRDAFNNVLDFLGTLPGRVANALANAAGWLVEKGRAVIAGLLAGFVSAFGNVAAWLAGIPGRVAGAIPNPASILYNIGYSIISGLGDGIIAAWSKVAGFLSSLGGKIRSLKGPPSKDAVLLYDIGETIMGGLQRGLESGWRSVEQTLTAFNPQIRDALSSDASSPEQTAQSVAELFSGVNEAAAKPATDTLVAVAGTFTETQTSVDSLGSAISALPGVAAQALSALLTTTVNTLQKMPKVLAPITQAFLDVAAAIHQIGFDAYYARNALRDTADEIAKLVAKIAAAGGPIPGRAVGGPVYKGQAYVVGEKGPELFIPNASGRIMPNNTATAGSAWMAGGGGVVVQVYGDVTGEEIVDKVREGLLKINLYNPGSAIARA